MSSLAFSVVKIRPPDEQSPSFGLISCLAFSVVKIRPPDEQSPSFGLLLFGFCLKTPPNGGVFL